MQFTSKNVEIGNGKDDSLFIGMSKQIEIFAKIVQNDTILARGFNVICHSQGALLVRGFLERVNSPPIHNMLSWAGPHDGVFGVPDLNALCPNTLCPWLDELMTDLLGGGWASKVELMPLLCRFDHRYHMKFKLRACAAHMLHRNYAFMSYYCCIGCPGKVHFRILLEATEQLLGVS